jgi:diguanylate cyclase (GGDEF)-like protein
MSEKKPGPPNPTCFDDAPFGVLVLDGQDRIAYANPSLEHLVGLPTDQLLGQSRETLPAPARSLFSPAPGRVRLHGPGAPERWLECHTGGGAEGSLRYFTDVTLQQALEVENRELREQLEAMQTQDPLTGLPNQRAIAQHLELHISRSRRYGNALSIALVRMRLSLADASIHREARDPALLAVSRYLRDRLRWVDQIARWDGDAFMVILPETEETTARELFDRIAEEIDQLTLPELLRHADVDLSIGVVAWHKGDDVRTLVRRGERQARPELAG